ncbi:MAG: enoyl-CoA hydratase/isomerase family protein [Deltaproteobacteria bacterium]|nr:enoyl-CoA hydratase/isomerase family protein [Deltaproteobacteria bacterium]
MGSHLHVEERGLVTLLTLSNPQKRNALDPDLCRVLVSTIIGLKDGGARCAVITGEGDKAFSSGFDLEALSEIDGAREGEALFSAVMDAMAASPVPILAALNGVAFGGGCELAAACDLRVGHAGVKVAMPPARLGLVYAPRGLARFSALVGEARAREMFLCARTLDAQAALSWGFLQELVPERDVLPRTLALAEEIASLAPLAVQGMRRSFEALLRHRATLPSEDAAALHLAREIAGRSADFFEAKRAFIEKRKPAFQGK